MGGAKRYPSIAFYEDDVDASTECCEHAIDLAWKRYHNGIRRFHPEREVTTGAAKFKLRHYLCSRAL
jgi:hypothetical protein